MNKYIQEVKKIRDESFKMYGRTLEIVTLDTVILNLEAIAIAENDL